MRIKFPNRAKVLRAVPGNTKQAKRFTFVITATTTTTIIIVVVIIHLRGIKSWAVGDEYCRSRSWSAAWVEAQC